MDTDDLSQEAYKAIMIEAELYDHNLTLQFGLLSYECENEQEFLQKSTKLIKAIKRANMNVLGNIFFGEIPDQVKLNKVLDKILVNINSLNQIPIDKRHLDF